MNKLLLTTLIFCAFFTKAFALTNICDISVGPDSRAASFALGEKVEVTMSYTTDEAAGVRIFARPFTAGSLTPGYGGNPSGLFTGSGTAIGWFTINSGSPIVDEIRIEVYAADNVTLLRRFWIPVRFRFGNVGVNTFTHSHTPELSSFLLGENFNSTFQYDVSYPGGVRVFVRPFTNGALTPGYGASGSGVYTGAGSSSSSFSINSGKNVHVDALRVKIVSADQSVDIDEFFIPVNLYFSTVKITDIVALGGNFPFNNDDRQINFNYSTSESGGVRIFPRPWTNGDLTPNYAASGSPIYNGSGTTTSTFTITSTNQRVDHVRFNVVSADQSETFLQFWTPVEYTFGNFLAENILLCPAAPARLEHGERVNIKWDYFNDEGLETRVFVRPFTNGALSPGYGASGSPLYPIGSGSATDFFTINAGNVVVDQLRFQVMNADQSSILAEYFIPVQYTFGSPTSPAIEQSSILSAMAISPNPAVDQASISLTLKTRSIVKVYVVDIIGSVVAELGEKDIAADQPEQFLLNTNALSAGTYFVVASGENFRQTEKLMVTK